MLLSRLNIRQPFKMSSFVFLCGLICHSAILAVIASVGSKDDVHGGVPMGVKNHFCDDGVNFTSIDWDPSSTEEYTCLESRDLNVLRDNFESCEETAKRPIHVCFPEPLSYNDDLPTSGRHRPLWPQYGEYRYLPPQRWLHSLEHGAVVFLYNPCADEDEIKKFKAIARNCLRRHIISPSKRIPYPNMFAVLVWQCKLVMTNVETSKTIDFVRRHAIHGPERSVFTNGQYSIGLIRHAKTVTTIDDAEICPQMLMMAETSALISERSKHRVEVLRRLKAQMKELDFMQWLPRNYDNGRRR